MIVDLLTLSATHHQQVNKLTFGAINTFPLSQTWSDQLEEAVNLILPYFQFSFSVSYRLNSLKSHWLGGRVENKR